MDNPISGSKWYNVEVSPATRLDVTASPLALPTAPEEAAAAGWANRGVRVGLEGAGRAEPPHVSR